MENHIRPQLFYVNVRFAVEHEIELSSRDLGVFDFLQRDQLVEAFEKGSQGGRDSIGGLPVQHECQV